MQRFKLLACKVLYREISYLSAVCPTVLDVTYLRQGLHDTPDKLRKALQDEIDLLDTGDDIHSYEPSPERDFDAILLGYGLCSNAIIGLKSKKYKIIVPRAHDCITLFLGSKEKYREYFDRKHGGVYWYTRGWIENTIMPGQERIDLLRNKYTELYGEENADYLMETEQNWLKEYNTCAYVAWPELAEACSFDQSCAGYTKECACLLNWNFEQLQGDSQLLHGFINGNWDDERFFVLPPGTRIKPSFDEKIIAY